MSKVILVTGGAGFLGASFAKHLLQSSASDAMIIILLDLFSDSPYGSETKKQRVVDLFRFNFPLVGSTADEQVEMNKGQDERIRMVKGCAGDIDLIQLLLVKFSVTHVIHAAACPNVRFVEKLQYDNLQRANTAFCNYGILQRLLAAFQIVACQGQQFKVQAFVFISSSTVYGKVLTAKLTSMISCYCATDIQL
jgi:nucleoside-diphosphate-sugar epimerase